jgi:hypothetical protein
VPILWEPILILLLSFITFDPQSPQLKMPGEGQADSLPQELTETGDGYSISEWWLEAHTKGPGAHSHAKDDVFYVI